jgi:hypothetical protein
MSTPKSPMLIEFEEEFQNTHALVKKFLAENKDDIIRYSSLKMLSAILDNIFKNPKEDKFRKLKLSNQKMNDLLVQPKGALDILLQLGFVKKDDFMILERKCLKCELCEKVAKELVLLKEAMNSIDYLLYKEYGNVEANPTKQILEKARQNALIESKKKKEEHEKKQKEKDQILQKLEVDQKERKSSQLKPSEKFCAKPKLKGGKINTYGDYGIDLNEGGGG